MASATTDDASASKVAKVKTLDVRAAFADAGLSQDAINHILAQYSPYLDVEQKLCLMILHCVGSVSHGLW